MPAIGSTQQILFPSSYICECADNFIACRANQYIKYHRYKVGRKPDINLVLKVDRIRRMVCESECGLCPDEIEKLREELNKILS